MKKPQWTFLGIVGICMALGGLSEYLHYLGLWDDVFWQMSNILAPFVMPPIFLILSIIFDIKNKGTSLGKVMRTSVTLFLLFSVSLHMSILTLPYMRYLTEAPFLWWFLLLLPLLIEIHLVPIVYCFYDRHSKLFLILKYVFFVVFYIYGFFIYFVYGFAGGSSV